MDTHDQSAKNDANQPTPEEWVANGEVGFNSFASMQHALKQPDRATLTPDTVIQLQRTIGNQAVQRLISKQSIQRFIPTYEDLPAMPTDAASSRTFDFITIKLRGRGVEHWWIEIDDNESYGWWPVREATDAGDAAWNHGIVGVPGELNAVSRPSLGGSATRDPHHGHSAPETFHPYAIARSAGYSEDDVRERIRRFARSFRGDYSIVAGPNCHTFIQGLMRSVGLSMGRTTGTDPVVPETSVISAIFD